MPTSTQDISLEIKPFLEDLLEDAEVVIADPILKEEMLQQMTRRLDKLLTIRLAEHLSDEQMEAFVKMNEEKRSKEDIYKFLAEIVPDIDTVSKNAFAEFRSLYLAAKNQTK